MDPRFALRTLAKAPAFAITAILTLTLGIGSSTAIFTLLDQVSLRLLPVKDPERLVLLNWDGTWNGSNTGYAAWSYPWYEDLRAGSADIFEELFGRFGMRMALVDSGETEQAEVELVTGNYFPALGIGAAHGRVLGPADNERVGAHPVAVLSHEFWRDRFNADPAAIGKRILLNQHPFEIVGVAQRGFRGIEFTYNPRVFIPAKMKDSVSVGFHKEIYQFERRRGRWMNVFGRLREGVSIEQAQSALDPVVAATIEFDLTQPELSSMGEYGREQYRKARAQVLPGGQGRRHVRDDLDTPLLILMAMVGLLLLIACGNVANLLMVRASTRAKEIAVRFALGAGRGRVVRQLMMESAPLAGAGGILGFALAGWAARFIVYFAPDGPATYNLSTTPDWRIATFATAVSALTALVFGLAPALRTTRIHLAGALKDQAGSITGGADAWRRTLACSQIFFSLLLLIGAGLFLKSLDNLRRLETGLELENTLVFGIDPMQGGYEIARMNTFLRRLAEELEARPEIQSSGFGTMRVLSGDNWTNTVKVEGYESGQGENMNPSYNAVSPGYFKTLGIPLLEGRVFTGADMAGAPKVGIVNQTFAERYFKGGSAIGRRFGFGGSDQPDIEIVGVIPDVRYEDMREEIPRQVFVPFAQAPWGSSAHVFVRATGRPQDVVPSVRAVTRSLDASLPIYDLRMMEAQLETTLTVERLLAYLASAFGVLATLLAAVGLYGLLSYSVSRRRREIGLRMALGAQRGDVAWLVLKEVVWLFGIGAAAAIPAALALGRLAESQLHGVKPADPVTIALAVVTLAAVAAVAGYLPARRAARIDPMRALRSE